MRLYPSLPLISRPLKASKLASQQLTLIQRLHYLGPPNDNS